MDHVGERMPIQNSTKIRREPQSARDLSQAPEEDFRARHLRAGRQVFRIARVTLFRHVGRGDRWSAQIVGDRLDHYLDPRTVDGKPPPDPDGAIAWLHGGAQRLVDAVERVGGDIAVWTFLGSRPA